MRSMTFARKVEDGGLTAGQFSYIGVVKRAETNKLVKQLGEW